MRQAEAQAATGVHSPSPPPPSSANPGWTYGPTSATSLLPRHKEVAESTTPAVLFSRTTTSVYRCELICILHHLWPTATEHAVANLPYFLHTLLERWAELNNTATIFIRPVSFDRRWLSHELWQLPYVELFPRNFSCNCFSLNGKRLK